MVPTASSGHTHRPAHSFTQYQIHMVAIYPYDLDQSLIQADESVVPVTCAPMILKPSSGGNCSAAHNESPASVSPQVL